MEILSPPVDHHVVPIRPARDGHAADGAWSSVLVGLALEGMQEFGLVPAEEGVLVDPYAPFLLAGNKKERQVRYTAGAVYGLSFAWHIASHFREGVVCFCVSAEGKKKNAHTHVMYARVGGGCSTSHEPFVFYLFLILRVCSVLKNKTLTHEIGSLSGTPRVAQRRVTALCLASIQATCDGCPRIWNWRKTTRRAGRTKVHKKPPAGGEQRRNSKKRRSPPPQKKTKS